MNDLAKRARGLANLQEQMDAIGTNRENHKPTIDCLRACAAALDAAEGRVTVKPLEACFDGIRAIVKEAEDERARYGDIAATIRINALHHGATADESEAMVQGKINFISWASAIVERRSTLTAPSDKIAEAARELERAEVLCQIEIDRGDRNSQHQYAAGARACRDAIRALAGKVETP